MAKEILAFPNAVGPHHADGMTLRDYFAAAMLPGLLAAVDDDRWRGNGGKRLQTERDFARAAYHLADAMLAARKRRK